MDISTRHSASSGYGVDDRKYAQREPYSRELRGTHTDRIMRRRNDHSRSNRYGGSRASKGPYDRHQELTLREKAETTKHKVNTSKASQYEREEPLTSSREIVPYEQTSGTRNNGPNGPNAQQVMRSGEGYIAKRLASTIVTPSRVDHDMDENVTKRSKGLTRSLSFKTLSDQEPVTIAGDNQIIGALNDMEIEDQQDDGMMECEVLDEDLLGLDLK